MDTIVRRRTLTASMLIVIVCVFASIAFSLQIVPSAITRNIPASVGSSLRGLVADGFLHARDDAALRRAGDSLSRAACDAAAPNGRLPWWVSSQPLL